MVKPPRGTLTLYNHYRNMTIKEKIIHNLKQGTFIKNGKKFIYQRTLKFFKYNNLFSSFSDHKKKIKNLYESFPSINSIECITYGNYFGSKKAPLNEKSVVYSLGVGNHIDFDLVVANEYNSNVYLYDPTPESIEFMKKFISNERLIFNPYGVWMHETTLTFYTPKYGGSSSAVNHMDSNSDSFDAKCYPLKKFMLDNNHDYIDYLKMDIEGAALPILKDLFENNIFPNQVMTEFESPNGSDKDKKDAFLKDVNYVTEIAKKNGYKIYSIPYEGPKYYSIELLMTKV